MSNKNKDGLITQGRSIECIASLIFSGKTDKHIIWDVCLKFSFGQTDSRKSSRVFKILCVISMLFLNFFQEEYVKKTRNLKIRPIKILICKVGCETKKNTVYIS